MGWVLVFLVVCKKVCGVVDGEWNSRYLWYWLVEVVKEVVEV